MFDVRAICRWATVLALCVVRVSMAGSSSASAAVDNIYRDLGRDDSASALRDSANLLERLPSDAPEYGAALQARLDVLGQSNRFDANAFLDLQHKIAAHEARERRPSGLSDRLQLARAWARNDVASVVAVERRIETELVSAPALEQAEFRSAASFALAGVMGHFERVRPMAEPALAFWQGRSGAKASWHQIELAHLLAQAEQYTGDETHALALLEAASRLAMRAFGADSSARIRIDTARAGLLSTLGRSRDVLQVRKAVLDATRHRYGPASFDAAKAEAMLGSGLQEIGDYQTARKHYSNALSVLSHTTDALPRERGIIYANYANLLQEMGLENEALASYRRALQVFGNGPETTHVRAVITSNIGNTEFRLQHYARAKADFLDALALRERSDGPNSPGLAYALEGLGSACLALREYAEAEAHYRRALKLRGLSLADNHPTLGPLRFGLALARWGQHDLRGAFSLAVRTARHQQAVMATFAADFGERQSMAYRQLLTPATALAVTLAARLADRTSVATAWQLSMVERGLVARAQTRRLAMARARRDPSTAAALARWRRINESLGDAWFSAASDPKKLEALRQQAEAAERAIWPHGTGLAEVPTKATPVAALAGALPADGLLIAYSEGVAPDPARLLTAGDKPVPEDWYAFQVDRGGPPRLIRLGNIRALSAQIHTWYLDLRTPASEPERLRADGLAVRRAVVDPIDAARDKRHLFVVPEGELYRINFAALPGRDNDRYLIESVSGVQTLSRESELLLASAHAAHPAVLLAGAPRLEAAGEMRITSRSSCRSAPAILPPIPNAGRELDVLRRVLVAPSVGAQVMLLRGAQATKSQVEPALAHANVVHLATHGFAFDDDCTDGSGQRGVSLVSNTSQADETAEAMFSGLALSAPRNTADHAAVDVLSAGELATLDLSRLDWIVLSACDSGLGAIGRNEGVFGMRRALRVAGARTVIMSLWPVDDAATVDLMRSLYRARFVQHRNVPDSMGHAMRVELARRRRAGLPDHPYYWAAFVSEGAWR